MLPFVNLSGQAGDDWIGEGVAETVVSDLRIAGATVLVAGAGGSGASGNGGSENGGSGNGGSGGGRSRFDAYRALGADWVVEGAFQRVGDRLRMTSRILNVESGGVAYSAHVDGTLSGIFEAQDAIAAALVERLVPPARPAAGVAARAADATVARRAEPEATRVAPGALPSAAERIEAVAADSGAATPVGLAEGVTGMLAMADAPPPERADSTAGTGPPVQGAAGTDARRAARGRGRLGGFAAIPIAARPTTVIVRTREAPRVDGRLDDAVWRNATHLTEFIQIAPVEGAPGSERTEVWMAYDDDNLYFAFYAHYSDPGMMRIFRADRDEIRGDDRISVLFDTFLDQQRAYQFTVNGYGVQGDSIVNADRHGEQLEPADVDVVRLVERHGEP